MGSRRSIRSLRRSPPPTGWIGLGLALVFLLAGFIAAGPQQVITAVSGWLGSAPQPGSQGNSAVLRILSVPASQHQAGVTLTVESVIADPQRTVVIYRLEGLPADASSAPAGPQSQPVLRLPDGSAATLRSAAQDSPTRGYAEYDALPAAVSDVTFEIARLPLLRQSDAPENWRIPLHLQAGADLTALQVTPTLPAVAASASPRGTAASLLQRTPGGSASPERRAPVGVLGITPTARFTPVPTLPPATLDALDKRVEALLQIGYAGFSGKAGWVHMIDENYSQGSAGGSNPTRLRVETWYELDSSGLVIRYVTWQRKLDGIMVQSSAAKGQTAYNFTTQKVYPYIPALLKFDWGLLRSLQEDVVQLGLKVKTEDSVCADRLCLKVTMIDEYKTPIRPQGQKTATLRAETEYQLDLGTGRILQTQTSYFQDDGSLILSGGRPILIERASAPPAEVLAALEKVAAP